MALPTKKNTKQSQRDRRSHHALSKKTSSSCSSCKQPTLPHQACAACGNYRGKQIVDVKKRQARSMRKAKS